MKKTLKYMMLLSLVCLLLCGCSNTFAKREYDNTKAISQQEDRYAKKMSVFNPVDGGYSLTAKEFDGRETMWSKNINEDKDIELKIQMNLSEGTAKVVHVDEDANVTTIIECTPENITNDYVIQTVSLKSGQNRIKVVGKGCRDLELELLSSDF